MKKEKLTPEEIKKIKRLHVLFMKIEGDIDNDTALTFEERLEYVRLKDELSDVLPID